MPSRRPKSKAHSNRKSFAFNDQTLPSAKVTRNTWLDVTLLILILAGLAYFVMTRLLRSGSIDNALTLNRQASPAVEHSNLPALRFETTTDGVRVAVVDLTSLNQWCLDHDLPPPPIVTRTEPMVAETLLKSLKAATSKTAQDLGRVGMIGLSLESYRSAEAYLEDAAALAPTDFRWRYLLGCIYQMAGRLEDAATSLRAARKMNDAYTMIDARLGQIYLDTGQLDKAEEHLKRYAIARPEDWFGSVGLGRVALERGNLDVALRQLQAAVKRAPHDFQAHYYLAKTYAALDRVGEATVHFELLESLPKGHWFAGRDPLLLQADALLGSSAYLQSEFEALKNSEDWPRLIRLAERIIQRRPDDIVMLNNLASLYRGQRRFDDAHAVLDRAMRVQPNSALLHVTRAEVYLGQRSFEACVKAARTALELDTESAQALNCLGRALFGLQRFEEAERALLRAIEHDPDDPQLHYIVGEIQLKLGRHGQAVESYERAMQLNPSFSPAQRRLEQISGGQQ